MTRLPTQQARRIVAAGIAFGPRTNPCVCGDGQFAHAGKKATGKCSGVYDVDIHGNPVPCTCSRFRLDPAWELAYTAYDASHMSLGHALREFDSRQRTAHHKKNPRTAGTWSLGASDAGTCRRAVWYRNMAPADLVRDPVDQREARMGEIIHEETVRRLKVLFPWREFEQKVALPGLDREVRYDWYDPITAEVTDLKTAGDWRWDQVDDFGVTLDVWKQVFLYGLALHRMGQPVSTVRVTYLKRCNGHDQTFVEDFDVELAEQYLSELLAIAQALDIVHAEMERYEAEQERALATDPEHKAAAYDPGELLPRDRSGPSTDPLCQRCPFRSHCWNLVQAKDAHWNLVRVNDSRSGESYTILGPEPVDPNVEWAIQQNVEAKAQARDWEKVKDETKALIEGLEPRRYGDHKIDEQWYGGGPDYKTDSANLRRMLEAGERPDVANMPMPTHRHALVPIARRMPKSVLAKEQRDRDKALAEAAKAAASDLTAEVSA
jgi:hypothetical protein